jgi:twitching motility protein PilT
METLKTFQSLLALAVENEASDIHIKSNSPAYLRLNDSLEVIEMEALKPDEINEFIQQTMPDQFSESWEENRQVDYSYELPGVGRFRVNGFLQRGLPSIVMRYVKDHPPTFAELSLDNKTLSMLCKEKDGIVIICGPTGSGKSSTQAALINHINHNYDRHIVTLEDPIEYTHKDMKSVISQREIGIDCVSFSKGMHSALRQDPDVILIGEMRNYETFETALHAAETGHLIFSTLHAADVSQAVQRLFEFFPDERKVFLQAQLAGTLRAVIAQKLLPAMEGGGRLPVTEAFVLDSVGRKAIMQGNFDKIEALIESSGDNGSKTFNQDLYRLLKAGLISKEDALNRSPNPRQLEMNLKGIFLSSGGIVN